MRQAQLDIDTGEPAAAPGTGDVREDAALTRGQRDVLAAFALAWSARPRGWVVDFLRELQSKASDAPRYGADAVHDAIRTLAAAGMLLEDRYQRGTWRVDPARRSRFYLQAIDARDPAVLRQALGRALGFDDAAPAVRQFPDLASAAAIVRLELFSGRHWAEVERLQSACSYRVEWPKVVDAALVEGLDEPLFRRVEPELQRQLLMLDFSRLHDDWKPSPLPLALLAGDWLADRNDEASFGLRVQLALQRLWSGDFDGAAALVRPLHGGGGALASAEPWPIVASAVDAAGEALRGRFERAEAAYDAAFAAFRKKSAKRRSPLPEMLALPYVLSLLAQQGATQLDKALKFCLAESGRKQPDAGTTWGVIALAVEMRRGDRRSDPELFRPLSSAQYVARLDFWRWLMRAWLHTGGEPQRLGEREMQAAESLRTSLSRLGMPVLVAQLDAALAVLQARPAPADFFVPSAQEGWRQALAALASLGGDATGDADGASRLLWVVSLGPGGSVEAIVPHEQKRGLRGWNKPRELPLSRLATVEKLPPADAQVARAVRSDAYARRSHRLDLAVAIGALIGHPAVEFADVPGTPVALSEGQPELDVVDAGDALQVRLVPALAASAAAPVAKWPQSPAEQREADALRLITVVRDGAQRARVIRLTPAQKRAAQLIGEHLSVPKAAVGQLQQVLQGLGAHFQVHADGLQAARDIAADARLRAELAPQGDGVSLRLVAAPFGLAGPRVAPGRGRTRMIASVGGETLAVQRDLALERSHVDAVMDACPMLAPPSDAGGEAEWLVPGADDALALVEQLPQLDAIAAIDWPKGQPIRVETAAIGQLQVRLRSRNDWLGLQGGIALDEQLVFGLEQLLDWQGRGAGRFVPLGEGRYLALTAELRNRLAELASVAEAQKDGLRVAPVAASWLAATLVGAELDADAAFGERVARLEAAQSRDPGLPATLQAELRPYQLEGYRWAMRLAEAGFGACLADDMGLGKTLQALAVLLARAAGGPALIVAPTSLGGNWSAEARRFAPALNLQLYREGDRAAAIERAAAGDAVVVSYQLLQLNADAFAARRWHTLVLDEAQAIKNAAAKRSLAVHRLDADFRMALSGTPIENRLSELWSIMRVCNPGLLGPLARFNQRFAAPIERDRDRPAQRTLRRLIAPFVMRRTKAQVLDDLPPRSEQTILVEPGEAEAAHYEALRRQALASAEASLAGGAAGGAQFGILAQLMRLRRAACDPRLVSPQLGLVGAKVQAFGELAAELVAGGHKTLVFSQFVDFLSLLREPLDAAGIAYQYLDGATPAAERSKRVAAFQAGEGELFLISLKAGGFGLNLTVADYVVIADPWWNPAAEDQASGRAHRIGQLRPVTVYRLVNQGTLEERIVGLHQHKRDLADSVLEGGETGLLLKAEELVELIRGAAA